MPYFKPYSVKKLKPPVVYPVLVVQLVATFLAALIGGLVQPLIGQAILLGGLICILAQAYFNYRAMRSFGDPDASSVIVATYNAMWGKWFIVVALSLLAVVVNKELNAGVLYASLFLVQLLGTLALPILVKRMA